MYELLVLSLLMDWPLHAYLIAAIANAILGPWEQISRGTLSTLLTRLQREGLIEPADPAAVPFPSKRASKVWGITAAGRARFQRLMLDITSNPGTYQRLFRIKALHLHLLSAEDQLSLLDHYIGYCQAGLRYMQAQAQDMVTNSGKRQHTPEALRRIALDMMRLDGQKWQLEIDWARRLREQIAASEVTARRAAGVDASGPTLSQASHLPQSAATPTAEE